MATNETKVYEKALAEGSVKVAYGRIMLLGSGGVGKTSLRRGLMGLPFEKKGNSTIVADLHSVRPVKRQVLKGGRAWGEVTNEDEISELALLVKQSAKSSESVVELKKTGTETFNREYHFNLEEQKTPEATAVSRIFIAALEKSRTVHNVSVKMEPLLHLWDSGGQPVFLEVLPAFLTSRTMFLILFDASRDLRERVPSVQYEQGLRVNAGVTNITTLELMERWMANIHAYLVKEDKNHVIRKYPQIAVIGSRGDKLKPTQRRRVIQQLNDSFSAKSFRRIMHIPPIIIDNTTAGTPKEDNGYESLKKHIDSFVKENLSIKTPITWVLFRNVINLLTKESPHNHNVMNISEVINIADYCKINPEEVFHVLQFYHELGVFLYYPQLDGFKDKVIMDPKWFVDYLGKVLILPGHGKQEQYRLSNQWNHLHNNGILVESLYSEVWGSHEGEGIKPEEMMLLLDSFHLAVSVDGVKDNYESDEKKFLVPCMLQYLPPKSLICTFFSNLWHRKNTIAPIHVTFSTGYVLPGFFVRLVAVIVKNRIFSLHLLNGIYHDLVQFSFGNPAVCLVSLHDIGNVIEVQISCTSQKCSNNEIKEYCNTLLKVLNNSCQIVEESLHSRGYADVDEGMHVVDIGKTIIKVLCQHRKCKSQPLHYLTSLQCYKGEISCSKSLKMRQVDDSEAYWLTKVSSPINLLETESHSNNETNKSTSASISKPTPQKCLKILKNKSAKWNSIGEVLEVPFNDREELRQDARDASEKLEAILEKWFQSNSSQVTWEMFKSALKKLKYNDCVRDVENKQGITSNNLSYYTSKPASIISIRNMVLLLIPIFAAFLIYYFFISP